jgi:hypothetical protein
VVVAEVHHLMAVLALAADKLVVVVVVVAESFEVVMYKVQARY